MAVLSKIRSAWNAFVTLDNPEPQNFYSPPGTYVSSSSPSRPIRRTTNERTILTSILTRISVDVAKIAYRHVQLDDQGRYAKDLDTYLNSCLTLAPNLDQEPRAFRQDIVMTLFDKGVAAIVPVDTAVDPTTNQKFDIMSMRVGEIMQWEPEHIRANVYNEAKGKRQEIRLEKRVVAIVENPFYNVMNEPNSTLQRLIRKLNILDAIDEQSGSGKLDIIIQLPYVVKSEARRQQAEARRKDIEFQLKGSQYGIAYTDGTEKITQLNRPAENNLLAQVEWLTNMLYEQLGVTKEVMNGTADEKTMINYFNRSVEPVVDAIKESMQKTFVGVMGVKKRQKIWSFRDPFSLVSVADLAEIADKFTRNEILTSNEIRGFIGIEPSADPKADKLINSNMPTQDAIDAEPVA